MTTPKERLNEVLFEDLPYVALIKGNLSDEDRSSITQTVEDHYDIITSDIMVISSLDMEAAVNIRQFCHTEPFGLYKLIVINLDGSSTKAQNSLLTVLESPPEKVRFLIFSDNSAISTVESRSHVFSVLGDVSASPTSKRRVMEALEATVALDRRRLEDTLQEWSYEDSTLLRVWAMESLSRKFTTFSSRETDELGFPCDFADNLLVALAVLDAAKPQWTVRSILYSYIDKG